MYTLIGADGRSYRSRTPGALGGHRRNRGYGLRKKPGFELCDLGYGALLALHALTNPLLRKDFCLGQRFFLSALGLSGLRQVRLSRRR